MLKVVSILSIVLLLAGCSSSDDSAVSNNANASDAATPPADDDAQNSSSDTTTNTAETPETPDIGEEPLSLNDFINPTNYISLLVSNADLLSQALRDSAVSELDIDGFVKFANSTDDVIDTTCLQSGSISRTINVETTESSETRTTFYEASDCVGPTGSLDGTYTIDNFSENAESFFSVERMFDAEILLADGSSVSVTGSFNFTFDGSSLLYSFDTTRYQVIENGRMTSVAGTGARDFFDFNGTSRLALNAQVSGATALEDSDSVELTVTTRQGDDSSDFDFDAQGNVSGGELIIEAIDGSAVLARATADPVIALVMLTNSEGEVIQENRPWTDFFGSSVMATMNAARSRIATLKSLQR